MKLVIGGRAQGKCALLLAREGLSPADVCDGETCPLNPPPETPVINHVHLLARRLLEAGRDPVEILARYADAHPDAIFISDEVGCGVVPLDPFDRAWREVAGRVCCMLAEKSGTVRASMRAFRRSSRGERREDHFHPSRPHPGEPRAPLYREHRRAARARCPAGLPRPGGGAGLREPAAPLPPRRRRSSIPP